MSVQPDAVGSRHVARPAVLGGIFVLALVAAAFIPRVDLALNPGSTTPGVISFLGVGFAVLVLTGVLLFGGLLGHLPRTAVFGGAVFGYSALLVLVKFDLAIQAVYNASERQGLVVLSNSTGGYGYIAFPILAGVTAMLYGLAFLALTLFFRSRLRRRLGIPVPLERRFVTLMTVMFVVGVVGGVTGFGTLGFLEYASTLLSIGAIAILIAIALLGALALCTAAFQEATDQATVLRDVTLLSGFAWVGLAFIAAYHVLWLVFVLAVISLWPLKTLSLK